MSVAIKRLRQVPKVVTLPDGTKYAFVVQYNISMAWVEEDDVDKVLAIRMECCGGSRKPQFVRASETDIRRWKGEAER